MAECFTKQVDALLQLPDVTGEFAFEYNEHPDDCRYVAIRNTNPQAIAFNPQLSHLTAIAPEDISPVAAS